MIAFFPENLFLRSSGGYQIKQSLRYNSPDTARFNQTSVASPTDNKKCTLSMWVKRGALGVIMSLLGAGSDDIRFNSDDTLSFVINGSTIARTTNTRFRDPTAHVHLVFQIDFANATAGSRLTISANGVNLSTFGGYSASADPATSDTWDWNLASTVRYLSTYNGSTWPFDGYMSEIIFVDGQSLSPSSFGELDLTTGSWKPKKYAGTFGNNGFYLNFADFSNTTSTTLGKDNSGSTSNNWTPNNFSVTSGIASDIFLDTPTNNHCVLNPVNKHMGAACTLIDGNLNFQSTSASNYHYLLGTMGVRAGEKKYWEVRVGVSTFDTSTAGPGIATESWATRGVRSGDTANTDGAVYKYTQNGNKKNSTTSSAYGSSFTTGDIIGIAVDASSIGNVKIYFSKNGVWQNSGDPVAGTGAAYTGIVGTVWPLLVSIANSGAGGDVANFGQKAFSYTVPSGYSTLCNKDRPTPGIQNPKTRFDTFRYTGNGAARSFTGYKLQPDLVMTKGVASSGLTLPMATAIRGTGKYKPQNTGVAEVSDAQSVTAFNSDGFSVGTAAVLNTNTSVYLAKMFKSDPTNGVETITWTGDGAATKAISHNLGAIPGICIAFGMGTQTSVFHHKDMPGDAYFQVIGNTGNSDHTNTNSPFSAFSSSSITVTNNASNNLNNSGTVYWALIAREGPLFACGQYTGNGDADGPYMDCGFKPAWAAWYAFNNSSWLGEDRTDDAIQYNGGASKNVDVPFLTYGVGFYSYAPGIDILANGFKIRTSAANANLSGSNKYWFAFAAEAGKYANAA